MNKLLKFFKLTTEYQILLLEAFFRLGISRIILIIIQFKNIASKLEKNFVKSSYISEEDQMKIAKKISWAIQIMNRHTFWQTKCFVQALTAKKMLNKRNVESTLFLGVTKDGKGKFIAHAWVKSNTIMVAGGNNTDQFTVVSHFKTECNNELKLLLLCSLNELSEQKLNKITTLLDQKIDWTVFYKLVGRHRIYSVVYNNLKKAPSIAIDSDFMKKLKNKSTEYQMQALLLHTTELTRLIEQFQHQNIRVISIKGPALSYLIYGDISLRMSKDLDIIVSPGDLDLAEKILYDNGYMREGDVQSLSLKQRTMLVKTIHHFSYINKKNGINVELHWRLNYESYNFTFEQMWNERTELTLAGKKIPVLNDEENFLYLVFHGSKHNWSRLKWLCDIVELIKKGNLDWNSIALKAKNLCIEHLLAQTLLLAHQFFRTDSHCELFNNKTNRKALHLAKLALVFILDPEYDPSFPSSKFYFKSWKYMIAWNAVFSKKVSLLKLRFYPTEKDFSFVSLPDSVFGLYYFIRLFCVAKRKIKLILHKE